MKLRGNAPQFFLRFDEISIESSRDSNDTKCAFFRPVQAWGFLIYHLEALREFI